LLLVVFRILICISAWLKRVIQ